MILAILAGAVAGFVGFLPLLISMRLSKRSLSLSTANTALFGLAGVFVSLVILAVELIICAQVARGMVLPFGLSEMLALIVCTLVYAMMRNGVIARKER